MLIQIYLINWLLPRILDNSRWIVSALAMEINSSAKLDSYASPPLSPSAHWSFDLDQVRRGMDGDIQRMKQHDLNARFAPRAGMSRRGAADRFRQAGAPSAARGGDASSHATGRPRMSTYLDYGYTDSPFQGGPLQGDELQPYPPTLRDQQQHQQQRQQHPSVHRPLAPYDSEMVYDLSGQQGPTQATYEVVPPPYSARQSAAMEALSSQFGVPQYFPPNEPTGTGVPAVGPPYLPLTLPLSAYNPPPPGGMGRSGATQFYPANMTGLTPVGAGGRLEEQQQQQQQQQPSPPPPPPPPPQPQPQQPPPQPQQPLQQVSRADFESASVREVYAQFQRAVRGTFDDTRAGRLVEASRSLLEISEWLVTNARELGVLRDDQTIYADRLQLWNDFNICWLALCQKQKDMAEELFQTGRQPPQTSLLSNEAMDNLGKELIQLCDRMEQHGLVDYQLGIWEEEILSVLGQCLDIVEDRLDFFRSHAVTAASR
ncbi:uncharacterized protein BO97DRAFT_473913 [Aspergillus homomorphus CBS 101889]|uniref:Uncharacterized protein n=1 Tax=Aspergillus homomorphus (strain CBS 101889) TaxID=1450537 RepID=A0A395HLB6_ASPHC|nr:hypothetical protein BO97DRAFT_473913 [Aspergillus homomorphus CBS 101889]RAL07074.1 hypothetical protein BO97DRAFT_473913 [Aspergillus homomorphus CBS 101889]